MVLYSAAQLLFRTHLYKLSAYMNHVHTVYLATRNFLMLCHNLSHYLFLIVHHPGK